MLDLVGKSVDRFSHDAAQIIYVPICRYQKRCFLMTRLNYDNRRQKEILELIVVWSLR